MTLGVGEQRVPLYGMSRKSCGFVIGNLHVYT